MVHNPKFSKFGPKRPKFGQIFDEFWVSCDLTNNNKVFGNPENRGPKILDKVWSEALGIMVRVSFGIEFNNLYSK